MVEVSQQDRCEDLLTTFDTGSKYNIRPGQFSPARLAFRRERRHPLMPCIPAEGGEAKKWKEQMQEKALELGVGDGHREMHHLQDVLQFFETSLKNRIIKNCIVKQKVQCF